MTVARQLLRRGIGFDLSRPYLDEQAKTRIESEPKGKWKNILDGYRDRFTIGSR